jgi:hypothetical protein
LATYLLKGKVWLHGGLVPWHFVTLPKREAKEIRLLVGGVTGRGWGSVHVTATVGGTTWKTSLFPDKKAGSMLLPLKSEVRKAEGIAEGDTIVFLLSVGGP